MRNYNNHRPYAKAKISEFEEVSEIEKDLIKKERIAHEKKWELENIAAKSSAPGQRNICIIIASFFLLLFILSKFNFLMFIFIFIAALYAYDYEGIANNGIPYQEFYSQILREKKRKLQAYKTGLDGEILVEECLKSHLSDDFILFNDITLNSQKGNTDHILIGPNGIFVIETKNWPTMNGPIGYSDYKLFHIRSRGKWYPSKGNPIRQVKNNAHHLQLELKNVGIYYEVTPVLVFVNLRYWIQASSNVSIVIAADLENIIRAIKSKKGILTPEVRDNIVKYFEDNYNCKESKIE